VNLRFRLGSFIIDQNALLLVVWSIVFTTTAFFGIETRKNLDGITCLLNSMCAFAVIFSIVSNCKYWIIQEYGFPSSLNRK
jgi:hypothetical protein